MVKSMNKLVTTDPARQRARLGALSNLIKSNKPSHLEKYFQLLTDFDFLEEKNQHPDYGIEALISDYNLLALPEVKNKLDHDQEKVKVLKLIQGALVLSAHIIPQDKTQLAGQLWGRLLSFQMPELQAMLSQIKQSQTTWLRLLTLSLNPPGGSLLRTLTGHSNRVNALAVTPDGKQVISASDDKTLKVWNLETFQEVSTLTGHSDWVYALAVTPDGKQVISGSDDNTLKVWNLETFQEVSTLTGHSSEVYALALTPDGKQVISGSRDKTLKVWNLETFQEVSTLTGHSSGVYALALTPDGKQVISASFDNTLKVWNLETGAVVTTFFGEHPLICCAVATDGVTIVAGDSSGRVHFLRLEGMNREGNDEFKS